MFPLPMFSSLREKRLCSEFLWSMFSHIHTENGDLPFKSSYSVQMREMHTKTPNTNTFYTVPMFEKTADLIKMDRNYSIISNTQNYRKVKLPSQNCFK